MALVDFLADFAEDVELFVHAQELLLLEVVFLLEDGFLGLGFGVLGVEGDCDLVEFLPEVAVLVLEGGYFLVGLLLHGLDLGVELLDFFLQQ